MIQPGDFHAKPCAIAAGFDAVLHVAQCGAVLFARLAHFGAQGGKAVVELAFAAQRVGGEGAKAGTIQHQSQMLRPGMFATHFQAMGHRH